MRSLSVGDLFQTHLFRQQNTKLQQDVTRYLTELTSGTTSDVAKTLQGDYSALSSIERSLELRTAYTRAAQDMAQLADGQQNTLNSIAELLAGRGASFLGTASMQQVNQISAQTADGVANFQDVVSGLNVQIAGRALFAGAATTGNALADSATMLADLTTATAADLTAADVMASIDAWFDTPAGGFETDGYLGSMTTMSSVAVGETRTAQITTTAADPEMRTVLKAFATVALIDQGILAGNGAERLELLERAGRLMIEAEDAVIGIQGNLGSVEAKIDAAKARNAAEETSLQLARDALIGIDEYETASRLEEAQTQIEMLYTVTARISQLSLADFLR